MTIAYVAQAENSSAGGSSISTSASLSLITGDLLEVHVLAAPGSIGNLTVSGNGNTYTYNASATPVSDASSFQIYTFVAQNCGSGTTTPSVASTGGSIYGIYARQIRGAATTGACLGVNGSYQTNPGSGSDDLLSGNIAVGATPINILVTGLCFNQNGGGIATAGTTPLAFSGRAAVWEFTGSTDYTLPEDILVVGATGNVQATFGSAAISFNNILTVGAVYAEAASTNSATIAWTS